MLIRRATDQDAPAIMALVPRLVAFAAAAEACGVTATPAARCAAARSASNATTWSCVANRMTVNATIDVTRNRRPGRT